LRVAARSPVAPSSSRTIFTSSLSLMARKRAVASVASVFCVPPEATVSSAGDPSASPSSS